MRRAGLSLLIGLWTAVPGLPHHILGIPHYAYDANYPQLPFVEILAQSGDWDLRISYMPGLITPGERIRFKLYGKSRTSGAPLQVPLVGQVRRVRFGSAPEPVEAPFPIEVGKGPEGNDYKFFLTFPATETYQLLIRFPFPDGSVEEIPFPVQVGATDDRYLFGLAVGLLVGTVLYVRIRKRARGRAAASPKSAS